MYWFFICLNVNLPFRIICIWNMILVYYKIILLFVLSISLRLALLSLLNFHNASALYFYRLAIYLSYLRGFLSIFLRVSFFNRTLFFNIFLFQFWLVKPNTLDFIFEINLEFIIQNKTNFDYSFIRTYSYILDVLELTSFTQSHT